MTKEQALITGTYPEVGMKCWDKIKGYGEIAYVEPDGSFGVVFPDNNRLRFSAGGYVGNTRRVFWHDPMTVEPPYDTVLWEFFHRGSRELFELMEKSRSARVK